MEKILSSTVVLVFSVNFLRVLRRVRVKTFLKNKKVKKTKIAKANLYKGISKNFILIMSTICCKLNPLGLISYFTKKVFDYLLKRICKTPNTKRKSAICFNSLSYSRVKNPANISIKPLSKGLR